MPNTRSEMEDYVFSLSSNDFKRLQDAVNLRSNRDKYHATTFEELAEYVGRPVICPKCNSKRYILNGHTPSGRKRYRCQDCQSTFTLLNQSIFNSAKIPFDKFINYVVLMSFNVPIDMLKELCEISANTAMLWRKKIFDTVNNYQDKVLLRDTVWIDETYINDASVLHENNDVKNEAYLSRRYVLLLQLISIKTYMQIYADIQNHQRQRYIKL